MQVLVTGGAGFIGARVAASLLDAGHQVRVLDALLPTAHPTRTKPPPDGVDFLHGDVREPGDVDRALHGVDVVCHQAAMVGLETGIADAPGYVGCTALGTAELLAGMERHDVARLVLAGSMVVYGEGRYQCAQHGPVRAAERRDSDLAAGRFDPPCPHCAAPLSPRLVSEDAPADPRNVYATTKLTQEHLASAWAHATGGSAVSLRYHNVYGPGMPRDTPYAGVASLFRSALRRGAAPQVFEDGAQRRDFIHVDDVAAANVAAVTARPAPGTLRAYNTGSGTPHTIGEMAAALASAAGGPAPVVTGRYRIGDVRHITADSGRIRAELGWSARVSFDDGMRQFAAAPLRGEE